MGPPSLLYEGEQIFFGTMASAFTLGEITWIIYFSDRLAHVRSCLKNDLVVRVGRFLVPDWIKEKKGGLAGTIAVVMSGTTAYVY